MPKVSQKSLPKKVEKYIKDNNLIERGDHIFVALSGGPDSVALTELLEEIKNKIGFKLSACHFNHKLREEESDADEKFVKIFCAKRNIKLLVGEKRAGEIIRNEDDARKLRYRFFEKISKEERGAKVALAHQKNDLVETLLLNLFRGTGLRGVRSIPLSRKNFIRPLLCSDRDQILKYLKEQNISFRIDKSNYSTDFNRNLVRLKIIPEILKINPRAIDALSAVSERANEDYKIIELAAESALAEIAAGKGKNSVELNRKKYLKYDKALRLNILSQAIRGLGVKKDITSSHILAVDKLVFRNIGKKQLSLPHSLQASFVSGRIILSLDNK